MGRKVVLKLLASNKYQGVNREDPIRFYYWPVIGRLYRKRVEICLEECRSGERILEVGFGTGLTFLNLHEMYSEIHGIDLTADIGTVEKMFRSLGIKTILRRGDVVELPYPDGYFDTVLLISVLEHLQPEKQHLAFQEIRRVLKPGGQVVYGVPVERRLMVFMFRLIGVDIRIHHYSTEKDIGKAATKIFGAGKTMDFMPLKSMGALYQVGCFLKSGNTE